jgi:nitrate reductase NapD
VNISGIVVACRPEDLDRMAESVNACPWAEVHHRDDRGRLVFTIEAADTDQSMERLRLLQALPGVLMAEMAGTYLDEEEPT